MSVNLTQGTSQPSSKFYGAAILASALALTLTTGCSTKNYVRSQTGPLIQQTNELDDQTATNNRNLKNLDEKTTAGISKAQQTAKNDPVQLPKIDGQPTAQ